MHFSQNFTHKSADLAMAMYPCSAQSGFGGLALGANCLRAAGGTAKAVWPQIPVKPPPTVPRQGRVAPRGPCVKENRQAQQHQQQRHFSPAPLQNTPRRSHRSRLRLGFRAQLALDVVEPRLDGTFRDAQMRRDLLQPQPFGLQLQSLNLGSGQAWFCLLYTSRCV